MPVTVVIPVWDDYVRYLPDAVASVREQAPEASIVIVDNASRMSIPEFPGSAVVRARQRLTVGGARNLGLEHVETDLVLVLDADDRLLPGTLDLLTRRMGADEGLAICATTILEAETGRRHRTPRPFVARLVRWPRLFAFVDAIWSLLPIQGCAVFRTQHAREAGGYADASWADDWVLAVSLAFRGRVEVHERHGRYYRATPSSVSSARRSHRDLQAAARLVRDRIRSDRAVPRWARLLLPLVAGMQAAAIFALRPAYLLLGRRSVGH